MDMDMGLPPLNAQATASDNKFAAAIVRTSSLGGRTPAAPLPPLPPPPPPPPPLRMARSIGVPPKGL
eukprot:scaffold12381_cov63-Phaeocystis_antarctica.AAC.6